MLSCTVHYPQGVKLEIKNKFFKEIISIICVREIAIQKKEPLKLVFDSGKTLYCDKQAFECYLSGEINQQWLVQNTECDQLYRNKFELQSIEGAIIDPGALWKAKGDKLTLVDDDCYATFKLNTIDFYIAE